MAFQPKLNRRRRTAAARPRPWRIAALSVAGLAAIAGLVALVPSLPVRADPGTARRELAHSLTSFRRGATTAARDQARAAVRADPSWGLAHAVLARYLLDLDDGAAAQAELDRARDVGFDPRRARHLYAHAYLLQGDAERAIATARQAPARYRGYAARVTGRALALEGATGAAWRQLSVVATQAPRDSRAWSDLARVHQGAGDLTAAALAATRAIALDPANGDALVLRGELIRAQYGLLGALPWFEAALKRDPSNHDALIEYAATLGEAGRYADMLDATRRALVARPGSPQAYYLQAVLAARSGNDDLARGLLERTGGQLNGMPGALLLGGALDYGAGAWRQAIAQWGDLVGQQPKNITARRLLAAALLRTGNSQGALDVLRPIALRDDADSYTLHLVGRAFEQDGKRDTAAQFLDRAGAVARADAAPFGSDASAAELARATAGDSPPASTIELIRALLAAGQGELALDRAQALVQRNPGTPAAYLLVGDIHAAARRWPQAAAAYRVAADHRFDEPTALRLVDAQEKAGDRAAAANSLAMFLSQNPANVAAQRIAAHWQIADGDWDSAIETLENVRRRVGNRDAALLAELAYAFLGKADPAGAEAYAAAAYRLAPSNPAAADAWGWALYNLGDYDRAGQLLEKAATIAPYSAGVRWHLAQTYAALGLQDKAAAQARVALLDRTFKERTEARALANAG